MSPRTKLISVALGALALGGAVFVLMPSRVPTVPGLSSEDVREICGQARGCALEDPWGHLHLRRGLGERLRYLPGDLYFYLRNLPYVFDERRHVRIGSITKNPSGSVTVRFLRDGRFFIGLTGLTLEKDRNHWRVVSGELRESARLPRANPPAGLDGGIPVLFASVRAWPAATQQVRSAKLMCDLL